MRLTAFTDYSLRVLIYLAAQPGGRRATIAEIARAFAVSENHLTKVVHLLGKAGLLSNLRGRGGGLVLARPAAAIDLAEVVRAAEGPPKLAECFDEASNECVITRGCRLREILGEAAGAFESVLTRYTIADLVAGRRTQQTIRLIAPGRAAGGVTSRRRGTAPARG